MKAKFKKIFENFIIMPNRLIFHPFEASYEFKHEKKGKLSIGLLFIFLFGLFRIVKYSYESFIINESNLLDLNSLREMISVVIIVLLFSIGNWAVTTLMEGKGSFKEIITMAGYSLFPLIIIGIPAIFVSNLMTIEEMAIYNWIMIICYIVTFWTLFMGMLNIHEYGLVKTILSFILTILAMAIMVFFALLFFSLLQQIISFGKILWQEINLRY